MTFKFILHLVKNLHDHHVSLHNFFFSQYQHKYECDRKHLAMESPDPVKRGWIPKLAPSNLVQLLANWLLIQDQ